MKKEPHLKQNNILVKGSPEKQIFCILLNMFKSKFVFTAKLVFFYKINLVLHSSVYISSYMLDFTCINCIISG